MWTEPAATISAPEATEATTVTSPSGQTTNWPERTGASMSNELAGDDVEDANAGDSAELALSAWPLAKIGMRPSHSDGIAPSTPRMRISRLLSSSKRSRKFCFVSERSEMSITTDFFAKKPGDRASKASTSASQVLMGISGLSTRAWKQPPRNLNEVVGRSVGIALTLPPIGRPYG